MIDTQRARRLRAGIDLLLTAMGAEPTTENLLAAMDSLAAMGHTSAWHLIDNLLPAEFPAAAFKRLTPAEFPENN